MGYEASKGRSIRPGTVLLPSVMARTAAPIISTNLERTLLSFTWANASNVKDERWTHQVSQLEEETKAVDQFWHGDTGIPSSWLDANHTIPPLDPAFIKRSDAALTNHLVGFNSGGFSIILSFIQIDLLDLIVSSLMQFAKLKAMLEPKVAMNKTCRTDRTYKQFTNKNPATWGCWQTQTMCPRCHFRTKLQKVDCLWTREIRMNQQYPEIISGSSLVITLGHPDAVVPVIGFHSGQLILTKCLESMSCWPGWLQSWNLCRFLETFVLVMFHVRFIFP